MARLKHAKEEADKEIAEFRAQMEAEFQKKIAEVNIDRPINRFHFQSYMRHPYSLPLSLLSE